MKVVCFDNGSASFYRAFNDDVIGLKSRRELLSMSRGLRADRAFICYPTWKRELSAGFLTRVPQKYLLRPPSALSRWIWSSQPEADPAAHQLENNVSLMSSLLKEYPIRIDLDSIFSEESPGSVLSLHPTASTIHKYYPLSFWTGLLEDLKGDFERVQIFCGRNPEEVEFCRRIMNGVSIAYQNRITLHANVGFSELSKRIKGSSFFIGSDSSLMHLSALFNRPTLGLWSFANHRVIYPYGDRVQVYIPSETLTAKTHEYPDRTPSYMARADHKTVSRIVRDRAEHQFTIQPRYKNPVRFYVY